MVEALRACPKVEADKYLAKRDQTLDPLLVLLPRPRDVDMAYMVNLASAFFEVGFISD